MKSRLDLLKPSFEIAEKEFAKSEISPMREFSKGDKVFVRQYNSSNKWMSGVVQEKIGTRIYDVMVNQKVFRRHIDQIIKNSVRNQPVEEDDFMDFKFESDTRRRVVRRKYPKRNRRTVNRYGHC